MRENVNNLFNRIAEMENVKDAQYISEFVQDSLMNFTKYFNAVYKDVLQQRSNRALFDMGRIDKDEYVYRIEENDKARRFAHNIAIDSCNQLNRLCDKYEIPHFCPEKEASRSEVADFIGKFVYDYYQDGIKVKDINIDKSIENAEKAHTDPNSGYNIKKKVREECR